MHILSGVIEADVNVAVVYPERELVPPQVRAFVGALVEWAPKEFASLKAPAVASARAKARPRRAKKKLPARRGR